MRNVDAPQKLHSGFRKMHASADGIRARGTKSLRRRGFSRYGQSISRQLREIGRGL
jgi:hypothetical protein